MLSRSGATRRGHFATLMAVHLIKPVWVDEASISIRNTFLQKKSFPVTYIASPLVRLFVYTQVSTS